MVAHSSIGLGFPIYTKFAYEEPSMEGLAAGIDKLRYILSLLM